MQSTPQQFLMLAGLLIFNTVIALLLQVVGYGSGFLVNLVFSQCVGCSVTFTTVLISRFAGAGVRRWLTLLLGLPLSVACGILLARLVAWLLWGAAEVPLSLADFLEKFVMGCIFALIGATGFLLIERLHAVDSELRERRLEDAERQRRELLVHLKLLQAQIEPHFLFNSLANVAGLIEVEPHLARELLERLNSWLRQALQRTRSDRSLLGDELDQIDNWLQILSVRFGARLQWQIDVEPTARQLAFPPLLLQPLVENAVHHGIEAKVGGGHLRIRGRVEANRLRLEVYDDGEGLADTTAGGTGVGLENVAARLQTLYGERATLRLTGNSDGGATAVLEIPCAS